MKRRRQERCKSKFSRDRGITPNPMPETGKQEGGELHGPPSFAAAMDIGTASRQPRWKFQDEVHDFTELHQQEPTTRTALDWVFNLRAL